MSTAQLVQPDSTLAATVRDLERGWQREFGGPAWAWDEAWLWPEDGGYAAFTVQKLTTRPARGPMGGSTLVWLDEPRWSLDRVWLRPELRRQGLLSAVWPLWCERYGAFDVTRPGPEMRAFLVRIA